MCIVLAVAVSGCAGVKTYTYEVDRPDQDLSSGNRGQLAGTVPSEESRSTPTRKIYALDIDLTPSKEYEEKKSSQRDMGRAGMAVEEVGYKESLPIVVAEPVVEPAIAEPVVTVRGPESYTIQDGDTLEKISKLFFGKASLWTKIYDANRDKLSAPGKIYPGQVILIPSIDLEEDMVSEVK